jgi:hypothetical protein
MPAAAKLVTSTVDRGRLSANSRRKKNVRTIIALMVTLAVTPLFASEPVSNRNVIAILNANAVETNAMERIRAFTQKELNVPVTVVDVPAIACTNLDAIIPDVLKAKKPEYTCMIALVRPGTGVVLHAAFRTNLQVAVINVTAMNDKDAEKVEIRVGKQVMRGAGFLFGLPPSLDPYCVMRHYRNMEDFDRIGRNFFPPWQFKFRDAARIRGMPFIHTRPIRPPKK